MKYFLLVFCLIISISCWSQSNTLALSAKNLNESGYFNLENDTAWQHQHGKLEPDQIFVDDGWEQKTPVKAVLELVEKNQAAEVWLRINIELDNSFSDSLYLSFEQEGVAIDVFVNGQLVKSAGSTADEQVSSHKGNSDNVTRIPIATGKSHVIALRYVYTPFNPLIIKLANRYKLRPSINIGTINSIELLHQENALVERESTTLSSLFFVLTLLFLTLYVLNPKEYLLLVITLFNFFRFLNNYYLPAQNISFELDVVIAAFQGMSFLYSLLFLMVIFSYIFKNKPPQMLWGYVLVYTLLGGADLYIHSPYIVLPLGYYPLGACVYYMISERKRIKGQQKAIVIGVMIFIIALIALIVLNTTNRLGLDAFIADIIFSVAGFLFEASIPLSFVFYVAIQIKVTLEEVKIKAAENKEILENQNRVLEEQVQQRTLALNESKEEIEVINHSLKETLDTVQHQKDQILASINYAQRIQNAILPQKNTFEELIPNHFVYFKPKDIVSGDFYYIRKVNNKIILAAVDCTGHGVPGAFMSFIGYLSLNVLTLLMRITSVNEILKEMHQGIRNVLRQKETNTNDGMDVALVSIDLENKKLEFAGAKNPLVYIKNGALHLVKGDVFGIGGEQRDIERDYTAHEIDIAEPTTFYIYSDGYQDQFGGESNKKFMSKRFRELLFEIHAKPMQEQREILDKTLQDWMQAGNERQIDDILVIGVQV